MFVRGVCKLVALSADVRRPQHARGCQRSGLSGARGEGKASRRRLPDDGLTLGDFAHNRKGARRLLEGRRLARDLQMEWGICICKAGKQRKSFFIETYGCQMNVSDSDIVRSIMLENGYDEAETANDAGVVMLNTCAIREKAEGKVISRLEALKHARRQTKTHKADTVAVLGCMASRLKERLLEQGGDLAHVVAGPDSYRDLPGLLETVRSGESQSAMSVALSLNETYADITPARQASMGKRSAFVSIMRGCNNMCSFCVVPLTRGRERCRTIDSIVHEVEQLRDGGFREVVLLGQNVNSYFEGMGKPKSQRLAAPGGGSDHHQQEYKAATGFKNMYRLRDGHGARFADLLRAVHRWILSFVFGSPLRTEGFPR